MPECLLCPWIYLLFNAKVLNLFFDYHINARVFSLSLDHTINFKVCLHWISRQSIISQVNTSTYDSGTFKIASNDIDPPIIVTVRKEITHLLYVYEGMTYVYD